MGFWQQISGILVLIGLAAIIAISYEYGKHGTIKAAFKAIFDLDWK